MSVVFPALLGPTTPNSSPGSTSKDTPWSRKPAPYPKLTSRAATPAPRPDPVIAPPGRAARAGGR